MTPLRIGFLIIVTLFAQTDFVEGDAQEYTRLVMQHDELLFKFNMHRVGNQAQQEMRRLEAAGAAIKSKYSSGRVAAAASSAFQKRVRDLSTEVIAPARKGWVVDLFPEPATVAAAYPGELEGAAAMQVLARTLADKLGKPLPTAASDKIGRYQAASAKVNPQSRTDYTSRLDTIDRLRRSKQFVFEVLQKFAPVYAVEAGNQLSNERHETAVVSDRALFRTALFAVVGLILAVPFLDLIWGEGRKRTRQASANGDIAPYQLPAAHSYVRVFRKRYPLTYVCGKILSRKAAILESTQSGYSQTSADPNRWTFHQGGPRRMSVDYEIQTPEGKTETLHFPKAYIAELPTATTGQLFSAVRSGKTVMLCYNHTTGFPWPNKVGIRKANKMPTFWLWLASMSIAFFGLLAVERFYVIGTTLDQFLSTPDVRSTIVLTAPFAIIYLGIIGLVVMNIRVWQFNRKWPAPIDKFMAEQTDSLERHFGSEIIQKHREKS